MTRMADSNNQCDLHIHSIFSDSDATLKDIFDTAKSKNLSCISITDHDTLSGIEDARIYSREYNIELVDGIEFSAKNKDSEVHILGYFVNPRDKKLRDALINIRELRMERLLLMVDRVNSLGLKINKEDILIKVKDNIPTRLHLGLYLVEKGIVSSLVEAFRKYLSPGRPAYVSHFKYSVKEAISFIKDAGGLAFLAHPHVIRDQSCINDFLSLGLDGLEINYPGLLGARRDRYKRLVQERNLLSCGGSDAHGSYKEFTEIGEVTIPYEWVQQMKTRLVPQVHAEK